MGWFQPAGAGTAIYCYNDADGTNHAAAPGPHTWAECNAAFPVDFPRLQSAAGAFYSPTLNQYLPAVLVTIGHPTAGNTNTTTFVDTSNSDVFVTGARLAFTTANAATTSFTLGTKIGTGVRMVGKLGGSIHMTAAITFRGTLGLYGTTVHSTGLVVFSNGTGSSMEVAGCLVQGGAFQLGNTTGVPFRLYNTVIIGTGVGNLATAAFITEGAGNVIGCTAPNSFLSSASSNLALGDAVLSGTPATADLRCVGTTPFWSMNNIQWSDNAPRIVFTSGPILPQDGIADFRTFDCKVVDADGNSLSGIPIYIESDVDGAILDDSTDADGNVTFTWLPTGATNVLPVRDYYSDSGLNVLTRDRVYTLEVNGHSATVDPNPNYKTKSIVFEWPGRDRLGTGYSADGGSFQKVLDIIQLEDAIPTGWVECELGA